MSDRCKYGPDFTEDELVGLNWLNETLLKIRDKGKTHPSFEKAAGAARGLLKLRDHCNGLHEQVHIFEELINVVSESVSIPELRPVAKA